MKYVGILFAVIMLIGVKAGYGQGGQYPLTLEVPVTLYDFHSDSSNPEFEIAPQENPPVKKLMVRSTLDAEGKPVLGSSPYFNQRIDRWFRSWTAGDSMIFNYYQSTGAYTPRFQRYSGYSYGTTKLNHDTSFINKTFNDNLVFTYVDGTPGTYQYTKENFFPLDDRGFGAEGRRGRDNQLHNFGFTMELHWTFTMSRDLTFSFQGDDDVWAFIGGNLLMDIGGIHNPEVGTINLNTYIDNGTFTVGEEYTFDFFYAERHVIGSNIQITTNIITSNPSEIHIVSRPTGPVCAGDTAVLIAKVIDDNGDTLDDFDGTIIWSLMSGLNNSPRNGPGTLRQSARGDTAYFSPTVAYTFDTLQAYLSANVNARLVKEVTVCHPEVVWIEEKVPDSTDSRALRVGQVFNEITIPSTAVSGRGFAVLRDRFGNFFRASDSTRWEVTEGTGLFDSLKVGNRLRGEGIVYKNRSILSDTSGRIKAYGFYEGLPMVPDDIKVSIQQITYDSLRIAVTDPQQPGGRIKITSLTTTTDNTTLLILQGYRSDTHTWEDISGKWSIDPSRLQRSPPPSGKTWDFQAEDTGHGTITAKNVADTAQKTSISVIVNPGAPRYVKLYPNATDSEYLAPSQKIYSDTAGDVFPLYAKVFDSRGVWLKKYDSTTAPVTWRYEIRPVAKPDDSARFTPRISGHQTGFFATTAGNVINLIATFSNQYSDTVVISVKPGKPDHITIHLDSLASGADQTELSMQSNQTTALLYAVLRDKYENHLGPLSPSLWSSKDTNVVLAAAGGIFIGEGVVTRNSDSNSETMVYVTNDAATMKDSIKIILTDITYTAVKIFYRLPNGEKRYDDTIRVRTDSSMILYAEGRRSDDQRWDIIPVTWTKTDSLKAGGTWPNAGVDNKTVTPVSVGNGRIFINRTGAVGDTVVAIFLAGLPDHARLYHRTGSVASAVKWSLPPLVDTIFAGDTTPIVAKIFDRNDVWLPTYENSSKNPLYSWTLELASGVSPSDSLDTLNKNIGYNVWMIPENAFNTYRIVMTFKENGKELSAPMLVYVKPGPPHHLVIEGTYTPSGTNLQNDNPLPKIEFGARDSVKIAFAIIRDRFGNFISSSQSTNWSSLNPSIVTANEGLAVQGEGRVIRIDSSGTTKVVAVNRTNTLLRDTVDVELSQFSYDALRIVVRDSVDISVLEMRSDEDTVLQVLGKRSFDGVWVPVSGDWSYTSNNGSQSATSLMAWNFTPADTGFGTIVVRKGTSTPDTVKVRINPGLPVKLVLYPKEGLVPDATNPPYPDPISEITAVAGTPFPLVAKALDHKGVWLAPYENRGELSSLIRWRVIELDGKDSSGFLDDTIGHKRKFTPVRAYQSVLVAAELVLSENRVLLDTVRLKIEPGKITQMVIEGSQAVNLNRATPLDTARITDSTTTARIYAIMRDSIGNFVRYSLQTTWGVVNNDTGVVIRNGDAATGEGVVSRKIRDGVVKVYGVDVSGLRDSTVVKMLPYFFKELRIVVGGNTSATSLTMNTNQDTTLTVQGLRSDSLIWVNLDAHWENSSNLKINPTAPGMAHTWKFSPSDTGKGWIRVTLDNDAVTKPDTLPVVFTPGPPVEVIIEIVTPADKRIAGEPIEIVVTIKNKDGLVPGTYCFDGTGNMKVIYSDTLGTGGKPKPFVLIGADTLWLAKEGKQCFEGGKDTLQTVLYYATDTLHRLSVQLGDLRARTMPFILHPGPLASLALEDPSGKPIGDTLSLSYPRDHVTMIAIGYDRYSNRIGPIESNWTTNGTLHPIEQATKTSKVIYQASNVTDNESGRVTAVPVGVADTSIRAEVYVEIKGPPAELVSAQTRDANGNGYLDQMVLTFTKPVAIPKGYDFGDIQIKRGSDIFIVDSVIGAGSGPDSVWVLVLREKITNDPQTNWVPQVILEKDDALRIDSASVTAIDGAGPVVWKVEKVINDATNVKKDEITVTFSEPIQRATGEGQSLTINDAPQMVLYVWELVPDGKGKTKYVLKETLLVGIENMQKVSDRQMTFYTTNGSDLAPYHYVSIKMITKDGDTTAYITDKADNPNLPEISNQKVRVIITGPSPKLLMGPNPTLPSTIGVPAGKLYAANEPKAKEWAQGKQGVMMQFTLIFPENADTVKGGIDPSIKIRCVEKIYDFVGNPVISAVNENLVDKLLRDSAGRLGARQVVSLYWNGFTKSGRPAAPGIYKVVIYIEYQDARYKKNNSVHNDIIGIGH